MENASKALLIAGAILLVIAIIAIGVGIVSKTRGTIGTAENQIDAMGIQMHNEKYKKFESNGNEYDKTFEEVRECVRLMIAENETNKSRRDDIMYLTVYIILPNGNRSGYWYVDDKKENYEEQKRKNYHPYGTLAGTDGRTIQELYNFGRTYDKVVNVTKYSNTMFNIKTEMDERGYIDSIIISKYGPDPVDVYPIVE